MMNPCELANWASPVALEMMSRHQRAAFLVAAGSSDHRPVVYASLLTYASQVAVEQGWQAAILRTDGTRRPYMEELVEMAIDELERGFMMLYFSTFAERMQVNSRIWERVLAPRYESLAGQLDRWCYEASQCVRYDVRSTAMARRLDGRAAG